MLFSPKHILVPAAVDSEQDLDLARHSVLVACDIALKFSSRITLLNLAPLPQPGSAALDPSGQIYQAMGKILQDRLKLDHKKLDELKKAIEDQGISVSACVINDVDDTADSILNSVDKLSADLVVMSSHGRIGLSKLLFGSVASVVVEKATIPVLILHPEAKDQKGKK